MNFIPITVSNGPDTQDVLIDGDSSYRLEGDGYFLATYYSLEGELMICPPRTYKLIKFDGSETFSDIRFDAEPKIWDLPPEQFRDDCLIDILIEHEGVVMPATWSAHYEFDIKDGYITGVLRDVDTLRRLPFKTARLLEINGMKEYMWVINQLDNSEAGKKIDMGYDMRTDGDYLLVPIKLSAYDEVLFIDVADWSVMKVIDGQILIYGEYYDTEHRPIKPMGVLEIFAGYGDIDDVILRHQNIRIDIGQASNDELTKRKGINIKFIPITVSNGTDTQDVLIDGNRSYRLEDDGYFLATYCSLEGELMVCPPRTYKLIKFDGSETFGDIRFDAEPKVWTLPPEQFDDDVTLPILIEHDGKTFPAVWSANYEFEVKDGYITGVLRDYDTFRRLPFKTARLLEISDIRDYMPELEAALEDDEHAGKKIDMGYDIRSDGRHFLVPIKLSAYDEVLFVDLANWNDTSSTGDGIIIHGSYYDTDHRPIKPFGTTEVFAGYTTWEDIAFRYEQLRNNNKKGNRYEFYNNYRCRRYRHA